MTDPVRGPLARLAEAMGVATSYDDYLRRPTDVSPDAVRLALGAMGLEAGTDEAAARSLAELRRRRATEVLPPTLVVRPGDTLALPARPLELLAEDGTSARLAPAPRGGHAVPADLPPGYHGLRDEESGATTHLILTPGTCPVPLQGRAYGWAAQLYATRSRESWGIGDCGDLAALAAWGASVGAAMVLVNPLHATAPVQPQEPSPYSPTSRRYRNPLYLRITDVAEYAGLDEAGRRHVAELADDAREASLDRIDRDRIFAAKMAALELLAAVPRTPARQAQLDAWTAAQGDGLTDFATYCALAERHGPRWQQWPTELRRPDGPAVDRARAALHDRVAFHTWLQWLVDGQLEAAQATATDAGMPVGVIHDLAVGVDPTGADAWALQDDLASGITIGAPPDGFNQRGQDWGLPPFLPNRLARSGYRPFRDMLRSVLRHAGGVRIDHVMGLWRLWWVPQEQSPAAGTYVRYPARDLLGVLSLEAQRAGAIVVGEDLGTVEEGVRETMAEHRVLSSRVVYFERVDDSPDEPMLPSRRYPRLALTSITTHDLPTAPGWWVDAEIAVQTDLGLFGEATTPAAEAERKERERADMLDLLRSEGLVGEDPSDDELVVAMHAFLARTPSLLVAASLGDAVGDRRQPNMPGTTDEYPNWRLPLARHTPEGHHPVTIEELAEDPRVRAVVQALATRRG